MPKRMRDKIKKRRQEGQFGSLRIHVDGSGTVVLGDLSSVRNSTVGPAAEPATFADDVMPAALTTLPVLFVIILLALTDQTVLLRSIVQEGNPLGLAILFIPLFSPTIVASLIYLAKARGWISLNVRWTNVLALVAAGSLGLFVPLNYLGLQIGVFAVILTWLRVRHRSMRWRATALTLAVSAAVFGLGAVAQWKWSRIDHLPRTAVGRVVDGLTRMNVHDRDGGRSVLVISVNDAYAIVASQGYPPRVETVRLEVLQEGSICQLKPNWNQISLFRHWAGGTTELAKFTEFCLDK